MGQKWEKYYTRTLETKRLSRLFIKRVYMATITKRLAKDGSPGYRVQIRLKGYPAQTVTFKRLLDAKKWALVTEEKIRAARVKILMEAEF